MKSEKTLRYVLYRLQDYKDIATFKEDLEEMLYLMEKHNMSRIYRFFNTHIMHEY